jgi:hypothetical protein
MLQNTRVTFAMRDLDRLKCIQAVVDGALSSLGPLSGSASRHAKCVDWRVDMRPPDLSV